MDQTPAPATEFIDGMAPVFSPRQLVRPARRRRESGSANPVNKFPGTLIEEIRFARDPSLEGSGFEPSVRLGKRHQSLRAWSAEMRAHP
jgi:hypothetical protein